MSKKTILLIAGIALIIIGLVGANMKIDTTWHYFGNGAVFGVGLSMLVSTLFSKNKK